MFQVIFRPDCKHYNGCVSTARMNGFFNGTVTVVYDSEVILGIKWRSLVPISGVHWFTTELNRSYLVKDVHHQWTKAGRFVKTRRFVSGVSFL